MGVARRATVDQFLDSGDVRHGGGFDDEADGHAGDGGEGDVVAAEDRVDDVLHDGEDDHDGDAVDRG